MKNFIILLMAVCFMSGCASVYPVRVNDYLNTSPDAPQITPGSSFFILENATENPLLDAEIKSKVTNLLIQKGYPVTTYDQANFYLELSYSMSSGKTVQDYRAEVVPDYGYVYSHGRRRYAHSSYFGATAYLPYWYTVYVASLGMKVYDGPTLRSTKEKKIIWLGEHGMVSESSDLRLVINYLLVAAFELFGQNTSQAVQVNVKENDPRLKTLIP